LSCTCTACGNSRGGVVAVSQEAVLVAVVIVVVVIVVVLSDAGFAVWDQCVCVVGCADTL
jgi:hypothetical protein